ncbi:glycoside hydrolase family 32 protein [Lactobacillus sp. ESL0791]|uniref:glycoside hydrolase family 32 protein n=1 Tax=Lactobacillus sp. ESL0791 TaxID=2983234 RepID=UPI0023F65C8E|nr:glycoside hydrolase family 32 protein [Lactobacillus sp. ESL0791]MDF7639234.1 glycoside hydrolase family 32 protein [Lactobacillus sp. ESL0791]
MQKIFYQPKDRWFGDCMPFFNEEDQTFYLFHQRDTRNPKPLTDPFGWSLVTTKDFVNFKDYGEVLPKGPHDAADQFIYAGSVTQGKGEKIAFYTGHNRQAKLAKRTSEILMSATSQDLIHWQKSGQATSLVPQPGYDHNDWRDPVIVYDEQQQRYVLVLGARLPSDKKKPTGRLVYFVSNNLKDWDFKGDFWTPNEFNMLEMPDLFTLNNTWYLLFSEYSEDKRTKYRVGNSLFGSWHSLSDEFFDGKAYYAARTVGNDHVGRYLSGWVATKENDTDLGNWDWGGAFVPHKIVQRADKTLGVTLPASIAANFAMTKILPEFVLGQADGKKEETIVPDTPEQFLLEAQIKVLEDTKEFGIKTFVNEETREGYQYKVSRPENALKFSRTPNYPWPQYFTTGLQRPISLEKGKTYDLKLIVDDSIVILYINGVALSARMYNKTGRELSFFVTEGKIAVTKMKYYTQWQDTIR